MPGRAQKDERNKVGPADPATRSRMLKERLAETESAGLYAAPAKTAPAKSPTKDISAEGTARKIRQRNKQAYDAGD